MPGQYKRRQCVICGRSFSCRQNLWRHKKSVHEKSNHKCDVKILKDLLDSTEELLEEVLQAGHDIQQERDARRQRLVETVHDLELSASEEVHDPNSLNMDDLRELLLEDQQRYLKQIELGRNISYILDEGVIQEESLTLDNKLALDIYRQRRQCPSLQAMYRSTPTA